MIDEGENEYISALEDEGAKIEFNFNISGSLTEVKEGLMRMHGIDYEKELRLMEGEMDSFVPIKE